jgi:hypothetical protein
MTEDPDTLRARKLTFSSPPEAVLNQVATTVAGLLHLAVPSWLIIPLTGAAQPP